MNICIVIVQPCSFHVFFNLIMEMWPTARQWRCRTIYLVMSAVMGMHAWHFRSRSTGTTTCGATYLCIVLYLNRWTGLVVVTVPSWGQFLHGVGWGITTIVRHAWWTRSSIAWRFQCVLCPFNSYVSLWGDVFWGHWTNEKNGQKKRWGTRLKWHKQYCLRHLSLVPRSRMTL